MRVALLLCAAAAASAMSVSHVDLLRAHTRRPGAGSPLLAETKDEVFSAINRFMHAGKWKAKACEAFTLAELEAVESAVAAHTAAELDGLYKAKGDRRALLPSAPLPRHPTHSAEHNTTRDGHCAYVLMRWAHHIPSEARELLHKAGVALPLMPASGPQETSDDTYNLKVSCTACHYLNNKESKEVAQRPRSAAEPPIPRWGGNNETLAFQVKVNMTDISDSPDHPRWQFDYYYNATQGVSVYDHLAGQDDEVCRVSVKQGEPCRILFANNGNCYIKSEKKCCHYAALKWGAVRSEWLFTESSYSGATNVSGYAVDEWFKQGASDNHYYATANAAQLPVRYMEHKNGKLKQWDFDLSTYKTETLASDFFDVPSDCWMPCM
eukprot:TRINITY_DN846_c0_g1_i11.p2 TRINITY_DN846_c0_g1~~TRINITY_DN846_c0_g1_i11.p2  ORF type:complete len:397 (+),score=156.38 TRINITY_DN846_c0_g1_i11:54-1193(+)